MKFRTHFSTALLAMLVSSVLAQPATPSNPTPQQPATENQPVNKPQAETQVRKDLSPIETVKEFYRLLRTKHYVEGFRLSVYRGAIETLTDEDLKDLQPDFENTFSRIPEEIKILGTQINTRNATVYIKSDDDPKAATAEEVALIKVDDQWLVGDDETLAMVHEQGRHFFFNIRIKVNEIGADQIIARYVGSEKLYADANRGRYGSVDDLVQANFWPPSLKGGIASGYRFSIELAADKRSYWVHAEPIEYNRSGKDSFYGDINGVHRFDNGGQVYHMQLNSK